MTVNNLRVLKIIIVSILFLGCSNAVYSQFNEDKQIASISTKTTNLSASELLNLGVKALNNCQYIQSRKYLDYAKTKAINSDSVNVEILASNNIGNLYYYLNEPDSALHYYFEALDLAEQKEDLEIQNTLNNNIGIIYASTNHPLEAKTVMEKALAISIILNDSSKMATNLINLSSQEVLLGNTKMAEELLKRAKNLLAKINSTQGLFAIYVNLGNIQFADSNYNEALNYYLSANNEIGNLHVKDQINIDINIGRAYLFLKNYEEALKYLHRSLNQSIESKNIQSTSEALTWIAETKNTMGDFSGANQSYVQLLEIKDSIILLEKNDWIEQNKAKHQFELKQQEFQLFTENSRKRTILIRTLLVGLLIIILLLAYILRTRIILSKQKEKLHKEETQRNTQKLQLATSKNKELEQTIETINYELVSKTLLIDNKNQILQSVGTVVKNAERAETSSVNQQVSQLKQHLLRDHNVEQNWEDFKMYFERVNTDFFKKIHQTYPKLTSNDLRLMAFLLLELNSKEIAQILNISPDSVRKRKQRLREKLQLNKSENLLNHLYTFT